MQADALARCEAEIAAATSLVMRDGEQISGYIWLLDWVREKRLIEKEAKREV